MYVQDWVSRICGSSLRPRCRVLPWHQPVIRLLAGQEIQDERVALHRRGNVLDGEVLEPGHRRHPFHEAVEQPAPRPGPRRLTGRRRREVQHRRHLGLPGGLVLREDLGQLLARQCARRALRQARLQQVGERDNVLHACKVTPSNVGRDFVCRVPCQHDAISAPVLQHALVEVGHAGLDDRRPDVAKGQLLADVHVLAPGRELLHVLLRVPHALLRRRVQFLVEEEPRAALAARDQHGRVLCAVAVVVLPDAHPRRDRDGAKHDAVVGREGLLGIDLGVWRLLEGERPHEVSRLTIYAIHAQDKGALVCAAVGAEGGGTL